MSTDTIEPPVATQPAAPYFIMERAHLDEAHETMALGIRHHLEWFKKWTGVPGTAAEIRKIQVILAAALEKLV